MSDIRAQVQECVALLASAEKQRQYGVVDEIVCSFADDHYHPKSQAFVDAFSEGELIDLAHLHGLLCRASDRLGSVQNPTIDAVLKLPEWREMMAMAKEVQARVR